MGPSIKMYVGIAYILKDKIATSMLRFCCAFRVVEAISLVVKALFLDRTRLRRASLYTAELRGQF